MKRFTPLAVGFGLLLWLNPIQAQFGSAPLDGSQGNTPSSAFSTPKTSSPQGSTYSPAAVPAPPPGASVTVPQAPTGQSAPTGTSVAQTYSGQSIPQMTQPAANVYTPPAPPAAPQASSQPVVGPDKKWVRDERGARYVVSKEAILPQGWSEIPGPTTSAPQQRPVGQQMTPAYTPPQPPQGYPQPQQQAATYYQPQQQTSMGGDGMKTIEDQSGYRIKVAKDSPVPPGFREVSLTQPAAPPMAQPQYTAPQPMQPQAPTYQSQPNVYSSAPPVSNVPPTWQQQLPYQPPAPQFQNPTGPYTNQGVQPQPVPVVRSAPPGKKRVTDNSGLVYYVDQNTIIGPGMREITDEEMNQPPAFMMQQQPQQPQPQGGGSFLGRLFGR